MPSSDKDQLSAPSGTTFNCASSLTKPPKIMLMASTDWAFCGLAGSKPGSSLTPSTDQINFCAPAVGAVVEEEAGATHAAIKSSSTDSNPTLIVCFLSMVGLLALHESIPESRNANWMMFRSLQKPILLRIH